MKKLGKYKLKTPEGKISRVVYEEKVEGDKIKNDPFPMQKVRRFCYYKNSKWKVDGTRSVSKIEPQIIEKIKEVK